MKGAILVNPILWVGLLFGALLFRTDVLRPAFQWAFLGVEPVIYQRSTFPALFLSHFTLVAVSSLAAISVGVSLAVFVTRPVGRDFRSMVNALATVGQTLPPVAVLAIAVPAVGFGPRPTMLALFLYGLLPIIENAITGLEGVPRGVCEAAAGLGLSPWHQLRDVELPLAAPVILSGIRVSVTIAIGTATIGSTVGALTLGTPIFNGLVANNLPFVVEGAVLVALFAIVTDLCFATLDRWLRRGTGQGSAKEVDEKAEDEDGDAAPKHKRQNVLRPGRARRYGRKIG
jgi:osmoprotectant transport system permease protein